MTGSIAYLGPPGTYTESAALAYAQTVQGGSEAVACLCPYPTIAQTLQAVAAEQVNVGVVPVENSIQGSVTMTLDTLWGLEHLRIQQALVLPIHHVLISQATELVAVETVYSHPQALAQCQRWLAQHLPQVQQVASNSTTEALEHLPQDPTAAAIASERAAGLHQLPILARGINDYPGNCTRFWVMGWATPQPELKPSSHVSLAFSAPANVPGALVKPLQVFAQRGINLSRIESRPTKRSLGEYLFFIDLEANLAEAQVQEAIAELRPYTEVLKIFGGYEVIAVARSQVNH
ncbi:MAG: prephenate dehydratase [Spirulina sp. SIO3F2]|nr:prephenate dehydratase [Spirulina sp. SIO3F2]